MDYSRARRQSRWKVPAGGRPAPGKEDSGVHQQHLRRIFDRADSNHDGQVNKRELIFALRRDPALCELLGLPSHIHQEDGSRDAFERVFQGADHDDNRGELSWEEFKELVTSSLAMSAGGRAGWASCQPFL